MQEDTPGVGYVTASRQGGWTPVRPHRPKRNSQVPNSDSTDQDRFYTTIKSARNVTFQTQQGTPGLKVQKGFTSSSVSWIPVVPTPVAALTRVVMPVT